MRGILREYEDSDLNWVYVKPVRLNAIKQKLKRQKARNCKLPRENGTVMIYESDYEKWFGGECLDVEDTKFLEEWITWAAQTPEGRRISGTRIKYGPEDENGDRIVIHESWGHPPKRKPSGGTVALVRSRTTNALHDYLEAAGAKLDNIRGELEEENYYKATDEQAAAAFEVMEQMGMIVERKRKLPIDEDGNWLEDG